LQTDVLDIIADNFGGIQDQDAIFAVVLEIFSFI